MKLVFIFMVLLTMNIPPLCYAGSTEGRISYYSEGKFTSSGERFDPEGQTCAHKKLPFGSRVVVHYRGKQIPCRVNDRGPFNSRILDVSRGVARQLGMLSIGVIQATITY
jgi:rare lipoprotein A